MNPYALPATTHSYLARAAESLSEAVAATDVPTRYACAHVAALRAAAALLAARAHPDPSRRRSQKNAWVLLAEVAPELAEWARFFAGGAAKRAAAEAGSTRAVGEREADDLVRDADRFLAVIETGAGPGPARHRPDPGGGGARRAESHPRVGDMPDSVRSERSHERPSERRTAARTSVVWDALEPASGRRHRRARHRRRHRRARGTGGRARCPGDRGRPQPRRPRLARSTGTRARRRRRAASRATCPRCSISAAPTAPTLVLCHGVLEVVDDPAAALAAIRAVLRPGGVLSLLVAQRHAAVVARAMAGHFTQALGLLDASPDARDGRVGHRFTAAEATGPGPAIRLRGDDGARGPGLRRPGAGLAARPRARRHRRAGRAGACRVGASGVLPAGGSAAPGGSLSERGETVRSRISRTPLPGSPPAA